MPIINDMFPNHPNLLKTEWGVTPFLKKTGYAQKPIVGRTGQNITIVGAEGSTLAESSGKFDNRYFILLLATRKQKKEYFLILNIK